MERYKEGGSSTPLLEISVMVAYLGITVSLSSIEASLQPSSQVTAGGGTILL